MVTSQSSDLTMGSLLPDNVLRSLNIEEAKPGTKFYNLGKRMVCCVICIAVAECS